MVENPKAYYAPMHTAEHILNRTMVSMFNVERSFSNHIERKKSKCDYHFSRNLTDIEIAQINEKVNQVIDQKLAISEKTMPIAEAEQTFDLGKIPATDSETIRIISVGDYDDCPCSGVHVPNTSEIGRFGISTWSYNEGILRLRFKLQR